MGGGGVKSWPSINFISIESVDLLFPNFLGDIKSFIKNYIGPVVSKILAYNQNNNGLLVLLNKYYLMLVQFPFNILLRW